MWFVEVLLYVTFPCYLCSKGKHGCAFHVGIDAGSTFPVRIDAGLTFYVRIDAGLTFHVRRDAGLSFHVGPFLGWKKNADFWAEKKTLIFGLDVFSTRAILLSFTSFQPREKTQKIENCEWFFKGTLWPSCPRMCIFCVFCPRMSTAKKYLFSQKKYLFSKKAFILNTCYIMINS